MEDISGLFVKLFAILVVCLLLVVLAIAMRMIAADARKRGKPAFLVVLLAFDTFPLGLLLWLVFRPEPLEPERRRFRLNEQLLQ